MKNNDFFDHYWETERFKEVAREARPKATGVYRVGTDAGYSTTTVASRYSSSWGYMRLAFDALVGLAIVVASTTGFYIIANHLHGMWTGVLVACVGLAVTAYRQLHFMFGGR